MSASLILMGVVGRPHGVRGLLHVHSYTAEPSDLALYAPLIDDLGRSWSIAWRGDGVAELRDAAGTPVADRNTAEKLVNTRLHVDRGRLPPPDGEEFYLADLVGLEARNVTGAMIGHVAEIHDYGAGTSLEIAREGKPALLVPFTRAAVPDVDIQAGRLTVAPPEEVDFSAAAIA
jgi:16S rRNA processing protein RimM